MQIEQPDIQAGTHTNSQAAGTSFSTVRSVELPGDRTSPGNNRNNRNNLLMDPIIGVQLQSSNKIQYCSLPTVFYYLSLDKIVSFPRLRPHQAAAWHALLVQLAALSLAGERLAAGIQPHNWVQRLRQLTRQWPDDEPWKLVTAPDRPAFLQSPVPARTGNTTARAATSARFGHDAAATASADEAAHELLADYKGRVVTPDDLDILVTSKNHDVKCARLTSASTEDWLFALVSLQTQEGVMGAGKYGVARMNGGYGSRSYVRWSPADGGPGAAFNRDVELLQAQRSVYMAQARALGFARTDTIGLLWLQPWSDDEKQLQPGELHPLFVEICRRVRLVRTSTDELAALQCSSPSMRIDATGRNGVVADPWMPVQLGDVPKVLSIGAEGFSYQRLVELLFGTERRCYELPLLAELAQSDTGSAMQLECSGLCRGQGKTHGFHQRSLNVPAAIVQRLLNPQRHAEVADVARQRLQVVQDVQGRCLRPALISLFQKGPREPDWHKVSSDGLVAVYLQQMDEAIETIFFPHLWRSVSDPVSSKPADWLHAIAQLAGDLLQQAMEATPGTPERRLHARACALNIFEGAMHKNFADELGNEVMADDQQVSAG